MNVPDIFSPILAYMADTLPPPVFAMVMNTLSHALTMTTLLFNAIQFITSRLSWNPLEWDAQTVLPPFIILATAYFALVSFYRTTTWMLRTSIFFVKWGTFFGILMAGVGFLLGDGRNVGGRYGGLVSRFGNFIFDTMNDSSGAKTGRGSRSRSGSRTKSSRTQGSDKRKPRIWDSYEQHREHEARHMEGVSTEAEKVISEILNTADKIAKESGWWGVLRSVIDGSMIKEDSDDKQRSKTKAGGSRSR